MILRTVLPLVAITLCVHSVISEISTNSYLSVADRTRLESILRQGFQLEDVSTVYYTVLGYKMLVSKLYQAKPEVMPQADAICNYLIKSNEENVTLETAFYLATTWKAIGGCEKFSPTTVVKILTNVVQKDTSTLSDLYYAVSGLTALSQKVPAARIDKLVKLIQATLRKDDSLWNLAYTFHIAADIGTPAAFAFDRIEDAMVQADEVDSQYLQFEGGLSITSFLVNGIFKLSNSLKKKPPLNFQQTVKLSNYLLSRRSVQSVKGAANLLSALATLAVDSHEKPVCIALADGGISVSSQQPLVTVKVCDIRGEALPSVPKVVATSAARVGDDAVILSNENLQPSADKTLFTMNLMNVKPDRGFYKISITAATVTNTITVKVLSEATLDYLEIGTGDADQTTQPKLTRVNTESPSGKLEHKIEADSQQKLVMRFLLRDSASKKPMRVHQAFVRLTSVATSANDKRGHEIFFVAEPDAAHVYKFDMPVGTAAANFGYQSGDYNVELIIGDAVISNPFRFNVGTVTLKFPEITSTEAADKGTSYKQKANVYTTKPEIKHMFREPERRPPAFVSNLFSGLCLAPVLLLLILWARLGINISNFPLSLSAIMFHLGLGGIFVLFGIFWLKLDMFITLRYLLGFGVVTFLAGNKMLSQIAHRHKSLR
ncbi:dolichyl-diphosphooligosaccharide--protein glycosyltransferase subunit 2 [Ooceraea biroi]|uniref:Dolichyl-diphosphooligosaccharide--protein glycosyltransferase subunit 2 n=1 Tax=Ooceraea biroi TaxID=2015173 RepID=A0A026WLG8_OOCBI|nr:dolichyl-diphosphooligosaccharide--protein glycosyltransferase subunit 2 [Ooceraea biroi]EZA55944.1 Dolichyl-diphosphooligosaccharide--protein glycosyltransferase subunit [Ooceraea biroi]